MVSGGWSFRKPRTVRDTLAAMNALLLKRERYHACWSHQQANVDMYRDNLDAPGANVARGSEDVSDTQSGAELEYARPGSVILTHQRP